MPVLVSDNSSAIGYTPNSGSSISGNFRYEGKQYYYFGGWTHSPKAPADCTDGNSNINKAIINKDGEDDKIFLYNYIEGVNTGSSATRETARALVKKALSK